MSFTCECGNIQDLTGAGLIKCSKCGSESRREPSIDVVELKPNAKGALAFV